jgi:hypothetical protein
MGGSVNLNHRHDVAIYNDECANDWIDSCYPYQGTDDRIEQAIKRSVRLSRVLQLDLSAPNELKSVLSGRMRSINRTRR